MDIALYISELIKEHDQVGIPGVGTISRTRTPARFNALTGKFDPPFTRLEFILNDGDAALLSGYISKAKNLSPASAEFFANKFGTDVQQQLESTGKSDLLPLGQIVKEPTGYSFTEFHPAPDVSAYGLMSLEEPEPPTSHSSLPEDDSFAIPLETVVVTEVLEVPEPETIPATPEDPPAEYTQRDKDNLSVPLFDKIVLRDKSSIWKSDDDHDSATKKVKLNKAWVVYTIVVGMIGALAFCGYYFSKEIAGIYKELVKTPTAFAVKKPAPLPPKAVPIAVPDSLADSLAAPAASTTTAPVSSPAADSLGTGSTVSSYEIIGATVATMTEAQTFLAEMKAKKISAKILANTPPNIQISVGSYKTWAEAYHDLPAKKTQVDQYAHIYELKSTKK